MNTPEYLTTATITATREGRWADARRHYAALRAIVGPTRAARLVPLRFAVAMIGETPPEP